MKPNAKTGSVLQGYFRIERFRGAAIRATTAQVRPVPQPPRPDLLPAKLRAAAQAKSERRAESAWRGAPRPELLPGMGPTRLGGLRRTAQPRANHEVSTTPIPAGQLRVIGQGRPLKLGIRRAMESFFHADFAEVRVHEGFAAQAMGALAFTLGEELHFAPGLYDLESREGVELLGHELTHVVQQRDGRVANPYRQGIAIVQDPALEAEADQMGRRIADELWSGTRANPPTMQGGRLHRPALAPAVVHTSAMQPKLDGRWAGRALHCPPARENARANAPRAVQPMLERHAFSSDVQKEILVGSGEHRRHIIPNHLMKWALQAWWDHWKTHRPIWGGKRISINGLQMLLDKMNNYRPNLHPGDGKINTAIGMISTNVTKGLGRTDRDAGPGELREMVLKTQGFQQSTQQQLLKSLGEVYIKDPAISSDIDKARSFTEDIALSADFDWPGNLRDNLDLSDLSNLSDRWEKWMNAWYQFNNIRTNPEQYKVKYLMGVIKLFLQLPDPVRKSQGR